MNDKKKSRFFVDLSEESNQTIRKIFDYTEKFKNNKLKINYNNSKILVNAFFEPSTRTNYSFYMAAIKLGINVINVNLNNSATKKGESIYDTIKTFDLYSPDCFVVRSSQNHYFEQLKNKINGHLINGGSGTINHPTQSLLDLYTIFENIDKPINEIKILFIGDIVHSRVAKSNINLLKRFGVKIYVSTLDFLQKCIVDESIEYVDYQDYLDQVDVVYLLRYQFERYESLKTYFLFAKKNLIMFTEKDAKQLQPHAFIMHPGPMNRNIEIESNLVESKYSKIFEQSLNGLYVRMALLYLMLENKI